ncbi:MAG TPA: L-glutamate gamma-semialdehyde dehydrogenase [Thermoanaerobaculia bacterium]|jgi:1-pyrroline-5-carboxylate dehydrogenase|nr:L-glutamate gamma-semialdehyde dehydrogenase [Thermoanaerobaculia bacterium]
MSALPEFRNEALTDFSTPENKAAMELALAKVSGEIDREHPLVIGGERITGLKTFTSTNPAKKEQVLGKFQKGSKEHVELAIDAAWTAFESWKRQPVEVRAGLLLKAAKLMRERKHEFSAVMILEVGKTWAEADADTAEAIDFMEFYAREAYRYGGEQPIVKIASEDNDLVYIPLGVGAVIPPWNFPLAIMAGMTTAAVAAGNTVVLKPSSDSPWIAWWFFALLEEAGMPAGVVNFVSGGGGEVGDPLIQHPRVRFISFTGSKEVGLHINAEAAKPREGQMWIKRVVAEMGGKDAIIVDREYANLDDAATAVVASAFGFQGQKCSACSRAIIDEAIYDRIVPMIVEKTKSLRIGDPATADAQVGPVVNEKSMRSIKAYIDRGTSEGGTLLAGGNIDPENGYFVEPTVIGDVDPKGTIAQEEIFGPVLAIIKAKDFDDALHIANDTQFGLTGAVFTDNEEKLDRAREEFFVGNLYLNRKCTGALVGVHPFGGFNMSGTDSKAGGRDYLGLFLQAKAISRRVGKQPKKDAEGI